MIITIADINKIRAGDRLIFGEDRVPNKVYRNVKYNGGYECGNMSLKYILENYENVEWVRYES